MVDLRRFVLPVAAGLIGACILIGFVCAAQTARFVSTHSRAPGLIVNRYWDEVGNAHDPLGTDKSTWGDSKYNHGHYFVTVQYALPGGGMRIFDTGGYSHFIMLGQKVDVLYDQKDATSVAIDCDDLWRSTAWWFLLALVLCVGLLAMRASNFNLTAPERRDEPKGVDDDKCINMPDFARAPPGRGL